MPDALGRLLAAVPAVQRGWQRLPVAERQRWAAWVAGARTPQRQERRARTAGSFIADGRPLPGRLRRVLLRPRAAGPAYDLTDDPGGHQAGGHVDW